MARQRISEVRAKHLLSEVFGRPYTGIVLDAQADWRERLTQLDPSKRYVIKVDQAAKRRAAQGLVKLDVPAAEVETAAAALMGRGFRYLLVEEFHPHDRSTERYLAMRRMRNGTSLMYAAHGGTDIEQRADTVHTDTLKPSSAAAAAAALGLPVTSIEQLHELFNNHHLALLEINPLVVEDGAAQALDAAVEVDDAALNLVGGAWGAADFRSKSGATPEEAAVEQLSARSPASFNLQVLNPDGQIFVLLSGGGASLVMVDEIAQQGAGPLLGNYGEYSGDPTADEVQFYTRQVLSLLLKSRNRPKVLVVAGGVANFTNVATTFNGLIRALAEVAPQLRAEQVAIFVRRGGPHAAAGLRAMRQFLAREQLQGVVAGPEISLADVISAAVTNLIPAAKP